MDLYRLLIKPKSSVVSPIYADTIFGAFAWNYKYIYGEEKLNLLLEEYLNGNPTYIFSDCFPIDKFPHPLKYRDWECDTYDKMKRTKKVTLVDVEDFNKLINNVKFEGFKASGEIKYSHDILHNTIDRATGTTYSDDKGGLFSVREDRYLSELAVYVKCNPEDVPVLETVMKLAFENGIGAEKSTGKGSFEIMGRIEKYCGIDEPKECEYFVSLSTFIPAVNDPVNGFYKTMVKYGRLDREYASLPNPFKKPVIMLKAGAVFEAQKKKEFYGTALAGISKTEGVIQYGYALPIYMKG